MIVLGVDIGALAILEDRELAHAHDMPCLEGGPAWRRGANARLLAEIIARSHATSTFVEYVGPRPQEGAVGAFAFGRSRGVIEGVPAGPWAFFRVPDSAQWKRIVGIAPAKKARRRRRAAKLSAGG
jgi:hypothetical protein